MIAAFCKLPHPRSRGQASTMARIQSSVGEPCAATLLCAPRWHPNMQLSAAQVPVWGWLCPGGTEKCPKEPPLRTSSLCVLSPCRARQPSSSAEPEPGPGQAGSRRLLPAALTLLPGLFILAASRAGPSAGERSCGLGPVASFPLLPEEDRDILGECDNTKLPCFHPPSYLPAAAA